jgi:hypothetical protein
MAIADVLLIPDYPLIEEGALRQGGENVTYDPRRLQGATVYREEERAFAVGDRVQITAPDRERHLANRELGIVERADQISQRALQVRLDSGRTAAFERDKPLHLCASWLSSQRDRRRLA